MVPDVPPRAAWDRGNGVGALLQGTAPTATLHVADTLQLFLMQRDQAQRAADRHDGDMMLMRFMRDGQR